MLQILIVGLGGFVGAVTRFALNGYVLSLLQERYHRVFPAGTLLVNVLGCLIIGILMTLAVERESLSDHTRLLLITGFLGSLTTFSTFGYETVELLHENEFRLAFWNVIANGCLGFFAVWVGRFATHSTLS